MEIKINLINLEDAKANLSKLQNQLNGKSSASDIMMLIQKSSGGACEEVNEIYRSLSRIEVALSELIKITEIVINNTKVSAAKMDTDLARKYENPYSSFATAKSPKLREDFLLNKSILKD